MTKEEVLTENYSSVVRRILLLVGIVMMSAWGFAADAHASKLLTFTVKNEPLPNVLKNIERNSDYNVIFSYDDLRDYRVTATVRKKTAPKAVAILKDYESQKAQGQDPVFNPDKFGIHDYTGAWKKYQKF